MAQHREGDSSAVRRARCDVREIIGELRQIRGRLVAVVERLRTEASTAPTVATLSGEPYTVEGWLANEVDYATTGDNPPTLDDVIGELDECVRARTRVTILRYVRENEEEKRYFAEKAALKAAGKDPSIAKVPPSLRLPRQVRALAN